MDLPKCTQPTVTARLTEYSCCVLIVREASIQISTAMKDAIKHTQTNKKHFSANRKIDTDYAEIVLQVSVFSIQTSIIL